LGIGAYFWLISSVATVVPVCLLASVCSTLPTGTPEMRTSACSASCWASGKETSMR
jgi:hypothetical protein